MFLGDEVLLKYSVNKCGNVVIWFMSERADLNRIGL